MIDLIKLYSLIPVWLTLIFTQGHLVMRNLLGLCCKLVWSSPTGVDPVREMTLKKSGKYSKYGSFEHLLFLIFKVVSWSMWILFWRNLTLEFQLKFLEHHHQGLSLKLFSCVYVFMSEIFLLVDGGLLANSDFLQNITNQSSVCCAHLQAWELAADWISSGKEKCPPQNMKRSAQIRM